MSDNLAPATPSTIDPRALGFDADALHNVAPLGESASTPDETAVDALRHPIQAFEQHGLVGGLGAILAEDVRGGKAIATNWLTTRLIHLAVDSRMPDDPNWSFPKEGTPEYKEILAGIPDTLYRDFEDVGSHDQAMQQRARTLAKLDANQTLARMGWVGAAGNLAGQLVDPVTLAAFAIPVAGAAGTTSRLTNAVRAGLSGAAANAAITAVSNGVDHNQNVHDLAWAAITGFGLGAPVGAILRPAARAALADNLGKQTTQGAADEAGSILKSAGDFRPVELSDTAVQPSTFEQAQRVNSALEAAGYAERVTPEELDKIPTFPGLAAEQLAVEARARKQVLADPEAALRDYAKLSGKDFNSDNGRIASADVARELFPDYNAGPESRSANAVAVHEPASYVAKLAFAERLKTAPKSGDVFVTGGGTGSGKTTAVQRVPEIAAKSNAADAVFDSNLNSFPSARKKIDAALSSGRRVYVLFTLRDVKQAYFAGAIRRAERVNYGRTVPVGVHVKTHLGAAKTYAELKAHYADNPNVTIEAIHNDFDGVTSKPVRRLTDEGVRTFHPKGYAILRKEIGDELDKRHAAGQVSERVYAGSLDRGQESRLGQELDGLAGLAGDRTATGGPDTLSAARVDTAKSYVPMEDRNIRASTGIVDVEDTLGVTAMARVRRTLTSLVRGSKDAWFRNRFGRLFGDRVGQADKSRVNEIGADEIMQELLDQGHTRLSRVLEPAYREWADANNIGIAQRRMQAARTQFGREVWLAIEGKNPDAPAPVRRVADQMAERYADLLKQKQAAGVHGYENIAENPNYTPRQWNGARVAEYNRLYKTERLDAVFARAIKAAHPDMDEKAAALLARGFHNRIRRLGANLDAESLSGLRLDDVDYLRELLQEVGADSDTITYTVKQVEKSLANRATDAGVPSRARHRLDLDIHQEYDIWNESAQRMDRIRLRDMLEQNAETSFLHYLRTSAGEIALAKQAGFHSEAEFRAAISELRDRYRNESGKGESLAHALEQGHKLIMGRSLDDEPQSLGNRVLRVARLYNVMRTMGQVAFASVQDLGGLLGSGYLRTTLVHVPELRKMLTRAADGSLKDRAADELEQLTGHGAETLNNMVYSHSDGLGPAAAAEWSGSKLEHLARLGARGTHLASGMAGLMNFLQRLSTKSIVQRMLDHAWGKRSLSDAQLRFLGLSKDMETRVFSQLKQASETSQSALSSHKLLSLNMEKWTDMDARDAFVHAVRKEARRIVQAPDIGNSMIWMHKSYGKALTQFRNFIFQAYESHMLHGLHMRDLDTFTSFAATLMLSTLAVGVQNYMNTVGADKKVQDKRRSLDFILRNGIARANQLAFMPSLVDTVAGLTYGEPVFGYRASGLSNSLIAGNPTLDLLNNVGNTIGTVRAVTNPNYKFSQEDLNALWRTMAFQNAYGMAQIHNALAQGLPKHSRPGYQQ